MLAVILNFCKIPALAFALGMFIPLELNVPLVVGGAINWYVTSRSKDAALNAERGEKGTLLASGFIAGGALIAPHVLAALKRWSQERDKDIRLVPLRLQPVEEETFASEDIPSERQDDPTSPIEH